MGGGRPCQCMHRAVDWLECGTNVSAGPGPMCAGVSILNICDLLQQHPLCSCNDHDGTGMVRGGPSGVLDPAVRHSGLPILPVYLPYSQRLDRAGVDAGKGHCRAGQAVRKAV